MIQPAIRPTAEDDDATVVADVIRGDRAAFEALYHRHHLTLYRTALAMTRDRGVAEELLQEAFLRAYRHIGRVVLTPGASLRPWLHRIIINLSYDWLARRNPSAGAFDGMVQRLAARASASPERQAEQREIERAVDDAIADLPLKQRVVVILFYLHDMDLEAISNTLNVPPGTVKSRLFYGRARLRQRLTADSALAELSHAPRTA